MIIIIIYYTIVLFDLLLLNIYSNIVFIYLMFYLLGTDNKQMKLK